MNYGKKLFTFWRAIFYWLLRDTETKLLAYASADAEKTNTTEIIRIFSSNRYLKRTAKSDNKRDFYRIEHKEVIIGFVTPRT